MKHALLVALLIFSGGVKADWIEYTTRSNGDVHFYDSSRVAREGDHISVWTRAKFKRSVMAASSYQSHLRLDCQQKSETILQDTFFSDKNWTKPAMATNTHAKPMTSVKENSASWQLIGILCRNTD